VITAVEQILQTKVPDRKKLDKNGFKKKPLNPFSKQPNRINGKMFFDKGGKETLKDFRKIGSSNYATTQLIQKGLSGRLQPPENTPIYKESLVSDKSEKVLMFSKIHREDLNKDGNPINSGKKNNHYKLKESGKDGRTTRRIMRKKWGRMEIHQKCDVEDCTYCLTLPQMKPRKSAKEIMDMVGEDTVEASTYSDPHNWNKFCPNHRKAIEAINSKDYKNNKLSSIVEERLNYNKNLLTNVEPSSKSEGKVEGDVRLKFGSGKNKEEYIYNSGYNSMKPGNSKPEFTDWIKLQEKNAKKWEQFSK